MTALLAKLLGSSTEDFDKLNTHEKALLRPVFVWGRGFYLTVAFLALIFGFGVFAYLTQLRDGLAATGMRDTVSWGLYIINFVFFIGISHVGALLSSILRLTGAKWRHPITRMAESITFAALLFGALMPIIDLGRPERMFNLIFSGRIQSPILWDIISITTYLAGSSLFLLLPLIPDMALLRDKFIHAPAWRRWVYRILSFGWTGTPEQHARLDRAMNTMAVLILPIAVMVHTVVSWIFAMTLRPGWNSTIFGPYFVAGALASGAASVVLAMVVFRKMYRLEEFITLKHFKYMAALVLTLNLAYIYFNISEYVTLAYKMEGAEKAVLASLFSGQFAGLFWMTQVLGLIVPAFLLVLPMIKPMTWIKRLRVLPPMLLAAISALFLGASLATSFFNTFIGLDPSLVALAFLLGGLAFGGWATLTLIPWLQARPIPTFVIAAALIVIQAWLKRFIIVVPVLEQPFITDAAFEGALYNPTWVEWGITAGALAGFLLVYLILSRMVPIVSVWETKHGEVEETVSGPAHALPQPAGVSSPEV